MKIKILFSVLALGIFASAAHSQTNAPIGPEPNGTITETNASGGLTTITNPAGFTVASLFSGGFAAGVERAGQDAVSFVENTPTTNGILTVESGVLYATRTHAVGGFLDAYLPVGGTNSVFGAGFGLAYLDHNFYDATLNGRLGDTFTLPFVHIPLYTYIESGGGYNLSQKDVVAQAFSGALLKIPITQNQTLTIGGAVGTISDYGGNILAGGLSYTFSW